MGNKVASASYATLLCTSRALPGRRETTFAEVNFKFKVLGWHLRQLTSCLHFRRRREARPCQRKQTKFLAEAETTTTTRHERRDL